MFARTLILVALAVLLATPSAVAQDPTFRNLPATPVDYAGRGFSRSGTVREGVTIIAFAILRFATEDDARLVYDGLVAVARPRHEFVDTSAPRYGDASVALTGNLSEALSWPGNLVPFGSDVATIFVQSEDVIVWGAAAGPRSDPLPVVVALMDEVFSDDRLRDGDLVAALPHLDDVPVGFVIDGELWPTPIPALATPVAIAG